jgi:hypothetical protein
MLTSVPMAPPRGLAGGPPMAPQGPAGLCRVAPRGRSRRANSAIAERTSKGGVGHGLQQPADQRGDGFRELTRWRVRPHPSCSLFVRKGVTSRSGKTALLGRATGPSALVKAEPGRRR